MNAALIEMSTGEEKVINLSEKQIADIKRVLKDVQNAKFKTHEEHKKAMAQLLRD
ncbi:MAG: hypothetical protein WD077_04070 [Bacteroidia bacterium]